MLRGYLHKAHAVTVCVLHALPSAGLCALPTRGVVFTLGKVCICKVPAITTLCGSSTLLRLFHWTSLDHRWLHHRARCCSATQGSSPGTCTVRVQRSGTWRHALTDATAPPLPYLAVCLLAMPPRFDGCERRQKLLWPYNSGSTVQRPLEGHLKCAATGQLPAAAMQTFRAPRRDTM